MDLTSLHDCHRGDAAMHTGKDFHLGTLVAGHAPTVLLACGETSSADRTCHEAWLSPGPRQSKCFQIPGKQLSVLCRWMTFNSIACTSCRLMPCWWTSLNLESFHGDEAGSCALLAHCLHLCQHCLN